MTCSIRGLSRFTRSFICRILICNATIIHWVAIQNQRILNTMWCHFVATQWILVRLQI
jgi:hypothetical protein